MSMLVTGGCGFVGSNLAAALVEDNKQVVVVDDFSRPGSAANLDWLRSLGDVTFVHGDVRLATDLESIFKREPIECVFHLAGQVAMTTSLASPRRDFEVNVLGSINVLELVRAYSPEATVVYASSNKVYGELADVPLREAATRYEPKDESKGISESARLDFRTPYGCSKGAADQYMLDYARNFGLRTVVFRHSTIYGGRQRCTFDQGWLGWFCRQALIAAEYPSHRFTINGDGKQVRDLLYVSDAVRCYSRGASAYRSSGGRGFQYRRRLGKQHVAAGVIRAVAEDPGSAVGIRPAALAQQRSEVLCSGYCEGAAAAVVVA
jgi:CDP-paratose 2-epimerase